MADSQPRTVNRILFTATGQVRSHELTPIIVKDVDCKAICTQTHTARENGGKIGRNGKLYAHTKKLNAHKKS